MEAEEWIIQIQKAIYSLHCQVYHFLNNFLIQSRRIFFLIKQDRFTTCFKTCGTKGYIKVYVTFLYVTYLLDKVYVTLLYVTF